MHFLKEQIGAKESKLPFVASSFPLIFPFIPSNVCTEITFQECREEARPVKCVDSTLRVPYQPKIHRVKCLLADDDDNPDLDLEKSANAAEAKLEGKDQGGT